MMHHQQPLLQKNQLLQELLLALMA